MKRSVLCSSAMLAALFCAPQVVVAEAGYRVRPAFERIGNPGPAKARTSMKKGYIVAETYGLSSTPTIHKIFPSTIVPTSLVDGAPAAKKVGPGDLQLTPQFLVGDRQARLVASFDAAGKPQITLRLTDSIYKTVQAERSIRSAQKALEQARGKAAVKRGDTIWARAMQQVRDKDVQRAETKLGRAKKKAQQASGEWSKTLFVQNDKLTQQADRKFIFLNEMNDALYGSGGVYANEAELKAQLKYAAKTLKAFLANPDSGKLQQLAPGYEPGPGFAKTVEMEYLNPNATYE